MELNIRMIKMVQKHECLYNVKCPQYKEFEYKESLWKEIGKATGRTALECKKKWKAIRDGYKRNKQMANSRFHKPYKFADFLRFLDNFPTSRYTKPTLFANAESEVSTDLSTDDEFQYEAPWKKAKYDFDNSFDGSQEIMDSSFAVDIIKTEHLNLDSSANCMTDLIKEAKTITRESNEIEGECSVSFTDEETKLTQKIISEVKKYDCFYNIKAENFKNNPYKKHLWHKIGQRVGLTASEVKRKWKNITDDYKNHKLKGTDEGSANKHKYADALKFLDDFNSFQPSKSFSNGSDQAEVSTDLSSDDEFENQLSEKERDPNLENSFQDAKDVWSSSSTDDNSKVDCLNLDTNPIQMIGKNDDENQVIEENCNSTHIINDSEECTISTEEDERQPTKQQLMEKIINEVKKYNCIYDARSNHYKKYTYKQHLWHKIAKRVGLKENDVKKKWKGLRDQYRRYKLKTRCEGFMGKYHYRYAASLKFLDDYIEIQPCTNREINSTARSEVSTDLSSDCEFQEISHSREAVNPNTITSRLFKLLVNKINDANLTQQEQNDIEYAVSAVVYSKLAEYSKNKTKRL